MEPDLITVVYDVIVKFSQVT